MKMAGLAGCGSVEHCDIPDVMAKDDMSSATIGAESVPCHMKAEGGRAACNLKVSSCHTVT